MNEQALETPMQNESYSTPEMAAILGISATTIRNWLGRKFFVPSVRKTNVKKIPHLFSFPDLCRVAIFDKIRSAGVDPDEAAQFVNGLDDWVFDPPVPDDRDSFFLVTDEETDEDLAKNGYRFYGPCGESTIRVWAERYEHFQIISMKKMLKRIHEAIREYC
jgi:DNA-binding transcriptional MerR regulator